MRDNFRATSVHETGSEAAAKKKKKTAAGLRLVLDVGDIVSRTLHTSGRLIQNVPRTPSLRTPRTLRGCPAPLVLRTSFSLDMTRLDALLDHARHGAACTTHLSVLELLSQLQLTLQRKGLGLLRPHNERGEDGQRQYAIFLNGRRDRGV